MGLISNGTTIFDAGAIDSGVPTGAMSVMKKLTASSSATLSFVHGSGGVDFSTFKEYLFMFTSIHPETDNVQFTFNGSVDAGSNYNVTKTTTMIDVYQSESNQANVLEFGGGSLNQATGFQRLVNDQGNANDESLCGYLHLYNPSSTTFVKHFMASFDRIGYNEYGAQQHYGGYFNNTADIDALQFKFSSGDIDSGTITMYGIT